MSLAWFRLSRTPIHRKACSSLSRGNTVCFPSNLNRFDRRARNDVAWPSFVRWDGSDGSRVTEQGPRLCLPCDRQRKPSFCLNENRSLVHCNADKQNDGRVAIIDLSCHNAFHRTFVRSTVQAICLWKNVGTTLDRAAQSIV